MVSQKLADPVHAGAPAGAKDDIFIIFTKCLWLTEWRKSENTYGPSPDAGRIIDENIDAMKAFANKGGRSQAPTIILSGPGVVWHGTAMQEVATSFFMKSNAMWFGCSKKSLNGGIVGLERGGHQFMGLVSAFTDLVCVLRREYSMSDEVREALALALNFLVEHDYLMKPSESYLSAAKQCGVRAGLTPVDRWSSSEDAPWAEVISAPRTMSSDPCATSRASPAKAPVAAGARASEQQSAPRPNAGSGPQTMAQRRYAGLGTYRFNDIVGRNLLDGHDGWRAPPREDDHPEFLAREVEDVFRSYCAGLLRSESFDLKSCVIEPESEPKAEPAPKVKPPPPSLSASKGLPRRSAPAVHTGSAHTAKRPREAGGGSTGSVQIPGHYYGKARTKESPVQPSGRGRGERTAVRNGCGQGGE